MPCSISGWAGNGGPGWVDGLGNYAFFASLGMALNASVAGGDAIVMADGMNHRVRVISAALVTTTLAGSGAPLWQGERVLLFATVVWECSFSSPLTLPHAAPHAIARSCF